MYRSLNDALRAQFGCKVYKLSLESGCTCPNRDGTRGVGGCRFCGAGSGEFAAGQADLPAQLESARARVAQKAPHAQYIAYFQSYTATHAPVEVLEPRFRAALAAPGVVALSVATRPDCLPEPVLDLLADLNREKPVWVELGLQTIHPATAARMNRCFSLSEFDRAVARLKARGITVVVHMILGLPGESRDEILDTADYIAHCGADGVKFHLLHVVEGAPLAADWRAGQVRTLELDEYLELLCACVRQMPPDMVIHRLTGDGDKKTLLAPLWSGDKKHVLNEIRRRFACDDAVQGADYRPETETELLTAFDADLRPMGTAIRERAHAQGLLHQVVHCWIVSRRADGLYVWFQQRAGTKRDYPGCYDLAVGGHVGAEEDILDALVREIREEVGLRVEPGRLSYLGVHRKTIDNRSLCDQEFASIYLLRDDNPAFAPGPEVSRMVCVRLDHALARMAGAEPTPALTEAGEPLSIREAQWAGIPRELTEIVVPALEAFSEDG